MQRGAGSARVTMLRPCNPPFPYIFTDDGHRTFSDILERQEHSTAIDDSVHSSRLRKGSCLGRNFYCDEICMPANTVTNISKHCTKESEALQGTRSAV